MDSHPVRPAVDQQRKISGAVPAPDDKRPAPGECAICEPDVRAEVVPIVIHQPLGQANVPRLHKFGAGPTSAFTNAGVVAPRAYSRSSGVPSTIDIVFRSKLEKTSSLGLA